jgi:uncharacterized protein (DUF1684 family)
MRGVATACASLCLLAAGVIAGCGGRPGTQPSEEYLANLSAWKLAREEGLRKPDGWLTLVGLSWLEDGVNTLGSDPTSDVVFPTGYGARIGEIRVEGEVITLAVPESAGISHSGQTVTTLELSTDASGAPTVLALGSLSFYVIDRGGELGVRIKDRDAEALRRFAGMEYFPVDPSWRVEAHFEAYDEPRTMKVPNVLGSAFDEPVPGVLSFEKDGRRWELFPIGKKDEELFIIFSDATNGVRTYGGGRFLYAGPPGADGSIILDFNRSYNPPCVFTPFATCPLPPPENTLDVEVEAGELNWGSGH